MEFYGARAHNHLVRFAWLAALCLLLTSACTESRHQEGPLVLAPSSLQGTLGDVADAWAAKGHPRPVLSFAGTPSLARQALAGAPADLFISADTKWMDALEDGGAIRPGSRVSLLSNRLVLISPAGQPSNLKIAPDFPLSKAISNSRLAIADPDAVPAGRYARGALTHLNVWDDMADRIAPTANVRAALALVAQGEARLGIVYETDALAEPNVAIIGRFPSGSHEPIIYPMAILAGSTAPDAQAFSDYLRSDEALALFKKAGFQPPL